MKHSVKLKIKEMTQTKAEYKIINKSSLIFH